MKYQYYFLVLFLGILSCKTLNSSKLVYEKKPFILNNKLRIDGFYYNEVEERDRVFYNEKYGDGGIYKSEIALLKKIRGLYLSKDGSIRMSDGTMSGVYKNKFWDECNIEYQNNTETAIAFFECLLNKPVTKSLKGYELFKKRSFNVYGDSIKIQYYFYNRSTYIAEKKGIILNDSTFRFVEYYDNKSKKIKVIDELYNFRSSNIINN